MDIFFLFCLTTFMRPYDPCTVDYVFCICLGTQKQIVSTEESTKWFTVVEIQSSHDSNRNQTNVLSLNSFALLSLVISARSCLFCCVFRCWLACCGQVDFFIQQVQQLLFLGLFVYSGNLFLLCCFWWEKKPLAFRVYCGFAIVWNVGVLGLHWTHFHV